nr:uncharacterized protein LOC117278699 [Nicotiana tomentosiformis]
MSPEHPQDKAINSKKRALTSTQPLEDDASTNVSPILSSQAKEDTTSMKQVFHKKSKQSVGRSMRNVRRNLSEGFEGIKKETDQEINEVREATVDTSKKIKSEELPAGYTGTLEEKLKVEKFFADSRNNLMNSGKNGKTSEQTYDAREVTVEASKKKEKKLTPEEEFALKKFYADAYNNLMNSGKNGETDQETTDKNDKNEE